MSRTLYGGGSTGLPDRSKKLETGTYETTFRTSSLPAELSNWLGYVFVHLL